MKLSTSVSSDFASQIRSRGQSYYQSGLVKITSGSAWEVTATVRGTQRYQVTLTRNDDLIVGTCTCPYAVSAACKHLWATILAADARGFLTGDGQEPVAGFELDEQEWDEDEDEFDEDNDDDDDDDDESGWSAPVVSPRVQAVQKILARFGQSGRVSKPGRASWKKVLSEIDTAETRPFQQQTGWPARRQLVYIIDVPATLESRGLVLEVASRDLRKTDGAWGKHKPIRVPSAQISLLPDAQDQQILTVLLGAREQFGYSNHYYNSYAEESLQSRYQLTAALQQLLLPQLCATGRCWLKLNENPAEYPVIAWDDGPAWQFHLKMHRDEPRERYLITGLLVRQDGAVQMPLTDPVMLMNSGVLFTKESAARFDHHGAFEWIPWLRRDGNIVVPFNQSQEFLTRLFSLPSPPRLMLPEDLQVEEKTSQPSPQVRLKADKSRGWGVERIRADLNFNYDGKLVPFTQAGHGVYDATTHRLLRRDAQAEQAALAHLLELGFREQRYYSEPDPVLELVASRLPRVVRQLVADGWHVIADGKLYRQPGDFKIEVTSGIDWFELHGEVSFGDATVKLPALLAALKRGENTVRLGDGSFGLLPEEWLKKYGLIASLGATEKDHLRFTRAQAGLLDALLAAQPEATFDAGFARVRQELQSFSGIEPVNEPGGFQGTLREYQRDGLGWLHFLRRFSFGGCLADDMGLGKTIQILALLEARRAQQADDPTRQRAPSLVVVPKSLVFNWQQEAARFTPHLRVLDHTGQFRKKDEVGHFEDYDLILTTYGTLRNDAILFRDVRFDYVILDEAQAIKNASTESAKAARLLQCDYRLALSGTPIENHLGELWSLFDFLNPGLLGSSSVLNLTGTAGRNPDEATRRLLSSALRPFILRRTKDQVAKDLPPKLEQTIFCELEAAQRKQYNELRDHYRNKLLGRIETEGLNKSKMIILEALLRLRQAACHPGLLDQARLKQSSAKLDVLLPQLAEVIEEGHKTLVFSQFTSFLAIVRDRLDKDGVTYEYLDGRTRNRQQKVERFQTDPDCRLFLISLKAGGLGLNLTAAEYIFLLDPWWNPAVEAQAIDRAHRIGQTRQVFAYRLIAKDTVEEKVLALQNTKRDLADAIINADNSLIRNLKREDLELLLS